MVKKWFQYVSIKVAFIGASALVIVAIIHSCSDNSITKQENRELKKRIAERDSEILRKGSELQRLETQLIPLKIVSYQDQSFTFKIAKITQLGQLAGWYNNYGGQRKSYEDLLSWKKEELDTEIKNRISDEIERLGIIYDPRLMILTIENHPAICKLHSGCKEFEPSIGYDAKNVLHHLTERQWTERARAACLLRNIKTSPNKSEIGKDEKEEIFNKLISLMKKENEKSLFVSKMALDTYSELAGFNPSGVFDFDGAIKDWEKPERRQEILKADF